MFELQIPLDIRPHCLPSQNLSIKSFLAFSLPLLGHTSTYANFYISDQPSNVSTKAVQDMLLRPVPPPSLVRDLTDCIMSSPPPIPKSIAVMIKSSEVRYPLWLTIYWQEINRILEIKRQWSKADHFLQTLRNGGTPITELVDTVYNTLSNVPWSAKIGGFCEDEPTVSLSHYATTEWLKTTHENQMLELLSHDIIRHSSTPTEITIQSTYFAQSLFKVFEDRSERSHDHWIHKLG
jgi:hypothetical protein